MMMRRGQTYTLKHLVDIVLSGLVLLLVVLVVVTVWNAFFAPDKASLNQFRLMGDMLQGVIENPKSGAEARRELLFRFDVAEERESFKGTIFGLFPDPQRPGELLITAPVPPILVSEDEVNDESKILTAEKMAMILGPDYAFNRKTRKCADAGCLCFSTVPLEKSIVLENVKKSVGSITECRAFTSEAKKLYLDFDLLQSRQELEGGNYPVIRLQKDADCKIRGAVPSGVDAQRTVCIFHSLREETAP